MKLLYTLLFTCYTVFSVFAQNSNCMLALNEVNSDSLMQHVAELTGRADIWLNGQPTRIESRYAQHPDNEKALQYIKQKCESYGFTVSILPFSLTGKNIIAEKQGSLFPDDVVILCAHYDCVGSSIHPMQGADDNASGSAALIEAARVLHNIDFPYTIMLAFWDEEESGLLGSKSFAPSGPGNINVKALVNLDMIAWDGNNDSLALVHAWPFAPIVNFAEKAKELNQKADINLNVVIKNPGETMTDHYPFWLTGVTAIGITEDYDGDINPNYHLFSDSMDFFNIPYFTKMSKLAISVLCETATDGNPTGIHNIASDALFEVYPNPAKDILEIKNLSGNETSQLRLFNILGQEIFYLQLDKDQTTITLPSNISQGTYYLQITGKNGIYGKKILIASE